MALSFVNTSAWVFGTGAVTPTLPTNTAVNDYVVISLVSKYDDALLGGAPAGWDDLGTGVNTGRTAGNDNGNLRTRLFGRVWQSGDSMPSLSPTPNNVSGVHATTYRSATGFYDIVAVVATDDTVGTPMVSGTQTMSITSGDFVHIDTHMNGDAPVFGTTTYTTTGATVTKTTNVADAITASGTDLRVRSERLAVTAGSATAISASTVITGTITNNVGTYHIVRLRESTTAPVISKSASESVAITATETRRRTHPDGSNLYRTLFHPSFEDDILPPITASTANTATSNLSIVSDPTAPDGNKVFKIEITGAGNVYLRFSRIPVEHDQFRANVWVKQTVGASRALSLERAAATTETGSSTVSSGSVYNTVSGQWANVQAGITTPAVGTTWVGVTLSIDLVEVGDIFYLDAIQLEYGTEYTAFNPAVQITPIAGNDIATIGVSESSSKVASTPQYARPVSDISRGTLWNGSYTDIDEVVPSDTDYIFSDTIFDASDVFDISLSPLVSPQSGPHTLRLRIMQTSTVPENGTFCIASLMQGSTVIRDESLTSIISNPDIWIQENIPLTAPQIASITDYSNLKLRFRIVQNGDPNPSVRISWAELEVPESSATPISASDTAAITATDTSRPVITDTSGDIYVNQVVTEGYSDTDDVTYTAELVTPPANTLILLQITNGAVGAGVMAEEVMDVAGFQLAWTQIATGTTGLDDRVRQTLFWARTGSSPISDTLSFGFIVPQSNASWKIIAVGNAADAPVVQSATASAATTSLDATLPAPVTSGNAVFTFLAVNAINPTITPNYGYTNLGYSVAALTPSIKPAAAWNKTGTQSAGFTLSGTGSGAQKSVIAAEIANAPVLKVASDASSIGASDIASVGSDLPGSDTITVGVAETASIDVIVTTSDAANVAVAEIRRITDPNKGSNLYSQLRPDVNTSFENGGTADILQHSATTATYNLSVVDDPTAPDGNKVLKVEVTGAGLLRLRFPATPIETNVSLRPSVYVRMIVGSGRTLHVGAATGASSTVSTSYTRTQTAVFTDWLRITSNLVPAINTGFAGLAFGCDSAQVGDIFYVDAVQMEYGTVTNYNPISSKDRTDTAALGVSDVGVVDVSSSGPDPIVGSETISLNVTETTSVAVTLAGTDTGALGVTETAASFRTLTVTDTAALSTTETAGLSSTLPGAENIALGIAENTQILVTSTRTDTSSLAVSDVASTAKSSFATDTGSLSVAESAVMTKNIVATDTSSLSINDISSVGSTLPGADTTSIGVAETSSIVVTQPTSDTASIAITETRSIDTTLTRTDTGSITVSETTQTAKSSTSTDTAAIGVSEISGIASTMPGTESASIGVADQSSTYVTQSRTDASGLGTIESASLSITITSVDSGALSVAETRAQASTLAATDTTAVSVAEATASFRQITVTDTASLAGTENYVLAYAPPGTDLVTIGVSEFAVVNTSGQTNPSRSDGAVLSVGETSVVSVSSTRTDTATLSVTETTQTAVTRPAQDSIGIGLSESTTLAKYIASVDTAYLGLTDTSTKQVEYLVEQLPGSDALSLTVNESVAIVVTAISADSVTVAADETTAMFVNKAASDSAAIVLVEQTAGYRQLIASDTLQLVLTEDASNGEELELFVYHDGQWVPGEALVYRQGRWVACELVMYKSGAWQ